MTGRFSQLILMRDGAVSIKVDLPNGRETFIAVYKDTKLTWRNGSIANVASLLNILQNWLRDSLVEVTWYDQEVHFTPEET